MSNFTVKLLLMSIMTYLLLQGAAYPMGQYPRIEREVSADLEGPFTVIFYGGTYSNDPTAVAVLDIEGDEYTIEPYASEYNYHKVKGLQAEQALKQSRSFVSRHTDFLRSELLRISDEKGNIIGYELRPMYHIHRFGTQDILNVSYWTRDKTVWVSVDLKRSVRKKFRERELYRD